MTPDDLRARADVSRETADRLLVHADLVLKWNPRVNLISGSTAPEILERHVVDSLQIAALCRELDSHWADFGTGGGFPGLVVAIMLADRRPDIRVTLVESDQRKAAFLRTAATELGLTVIILSKRIEALPPLQATTISARALAPLVKLLEYAEIHMAENGQCLFHKGAQFRAELAESLEKWRYQSDILPSETNPQSVILRIKDLRRA